MESGRGDVNSDGAALLGVIKYQGSGNCWKPVKGSRKMEKASLLGGWAQQLDKRLGPDG